MGKIKKNEFREILDELLNKEFWIIDGNFMSTMESRIEKSDTVIFLDFSTIVCLFRVIKRRFQYINKTRPDMNPNCPEKIDLAFLLFVIGYRMNNRKKVKDILKNNEDKNIIILKNKKEVNKFIDELKNNKFNENSFLCYEF